ncbi:hypothetical protein M0R45_020674 [Rubus argutus]|uniref:Uncharacterized protein n=1 Tax=Rubus argutus TaxID=59490 RepID=A0AAW1X9Y7_RUBAR
MPEKGAMSWPSSSLKSSPLLQWRLGLLTALVLVGMVVIWSMDATTMKNLVEATKSQQANLEPNVTMNLLAKWLAPGGEPCKVARTVEIAIPDLDGKDLIELSAGEIL